MKKYIFLFISIALLLVSCQNNEESYVRFKNKEITVSEQAGEETILFETNSSWIASSSETWCTVTPSRGGQSSRSTTILLAANDSFEERSCEVSILAGDVTSTITITQLQKDAIIITNKSYELSSSSQTIEVGLRANVEVEVIIADDAKGWVSTAATRAMQDKTVTLYIADNKESETSRTTEVYIKDRATDLQDVVTIFQRGITVIPPDAQLIEGDANKVQHLNVEGDFVFRMNNLSNDDVFFVFSNASEHQSVALPQLVGDERVVSRSTTRTSFSDPSFIVSGKPYVTEFNNNPPKYFKDRVEGAHYQQSVQSKSANLTVGATEYLNDELGESHLSTLRKVVSAHNKKLYVWVADDCWHNGGTKSYKVTQYMVDALADKFLAPGNDNDIYEWVTNIAGEPWGKNDVNYLIPETDDIHIWLMDIDDDNSTRGTVTLGYFFGRDNYLKSFEPKSNERLMFAIDAVIFAKPDNNKVWNLSHFWPREVVSTLAHELTHMIYFYQHYVFRGLESNTAINEMCAMCVEDLVANKIKSDGPRGVAYDEPSAGYINNNNGRLPLFNRHNEHQLLDWNSDKDHVLLNYSKTYALGAYLMRNYGGAKVIKSLIQNEYNGIASIVEAVNVNGGVVSNYADLLQQFGAANLLSDQTDTTIGYKLNSVGWSKSTINDITYDLGAINLYNYNPAPYIYNELPLEQEPGSNLIYKAGSKLSGEAEWYFKGMNNNTKVTVVVK